MIFFFYLLDVGPEVVHLTCDDAGYVSQPQLLLHLLPLLGLPHLDVVAGTGAHQLENKKRRKKEKKKHISGTSRPSIVTLTSIGTKACIRHTYISEF